MGNEDTSPRLPCDTYGIEREQAELVSHPLRGAPSLTCHCFGEAHICERFPFRRGNRLRVSIVQTIGAIASAHIASEEIQIASEPVAGTTWQRQLALPIPREHTRYGLHSWGLAGPSAADEANRANIQVWSQLRKDTIDEPRLQGLQGVRAVGYSPCQGALLPQLGACFLNILLSPLVVPLGIQWRRRSYQLLGNPTHLSNPKGWDASLSPRLFDEIKPKVDGCCFSPRYDLDGTGAGSTLQLPLLDLDATQHLEQVVEHFLPILHVRAIVNEVGLPQAIGGCQLSLDLAVMGVRLEGDELDNGPSITRRQERNLCNVVDLDSYNR